jgi:hypothetical protein
MPRRLASLKAEPKWRWERQGRSRGRVAEDLDGVFDFGTRQEDGPGTWEALMLPRDETAYGEPEKNLRRTRRFAGARRSSDKNKTPAMR